MQRIDVANADFDKVRGIWPWLTKLMITAFRVRIEPDEINGLYAEWLTPKDHMDGKLLLYLHGGG